jgi:hypothetical protein
VYDYENDPNQLIPENEKFSRYKKDKKENTLPRINCKTIVPNFGKPM